MRQEKIGRQINACVLLLINEVELSIYKFLTLEAKKQPRLVELGANWLTIHWTINAWQGPLDLNWTSIGKAYP